MLKHRSTLSRPEKCNVLLKGRPNLTLLWKMKKGIKNWNLWQPKTNTFPWTKLLEAKRSEGSWLRTRPCSRDYKPGAQYIMWLIGRLIGKNRSRTSKGSVSMASAYQHNLQWGEREDIRIMQLKILMTCKLKHGMSLSIRAQIKKSLSS